MWVDPEAFRQFTKRLLFLDRLNGYLRLKSGTVFFPACLHTSKINHFIKFTQWSEFAGVLYIDRATRTLFFKVYDAKTSENAKIFMDECLAFFPFEITHVLTDNGLEFTNRLIKSKKGNLCEKLSKLDEVCEKNNIEHRLTKPNTPKTNGMVERANGIIKNGTILKENYADIYIEHSRNKEEMNSAFMAFLFYYMLYRRHSGVRKELNVKTPFDAIEKWFEINPKIFIENPLQFKNKILYL
jgi:hypothetical protein